MPRPVPILDHLLGSGAFSPAFNIYGAGCVLIEILIRHILFDGDGQIAIALAILQIMGTLTLGAWPES
jgi:hypothetical protein